MKNYNVTFAVGRFIDLPADCTKEQLELRTTGVETTLVDAEGVDHAIFRVVSPRGGSDNCRVISIWEHVS